MTDLHISVDMPTPQIHERPAGATMGWPMLILALLGVPGSLVLIPVGIGVAVQGSGSTGTILILIGVLLLVAAGIIFTGLTAVAPAKRE
jgi:hypothetical protein